MSCGSASGVRQYLFPRLYLEYRERFSRARGGKPMPSAPPTACHCGGKRTNGVCNRCGPAKQDRRNSNARGYDHDWREAAKRYLSEHPTCVCCDAQGRVTIERGRAGVRVDHIVPKRIAPERFEDESNWQTLCLTCDLAYKQPIEKRSRTAEQIIRQWEELLMSFKANAPLT